MLIYVYIIYLYISIVAYSSSFGRVREPPSGHSRSPGPGFGLQVPQRMQEVWVQNILVICSLIVLRKEEICALLSPVGQSIRTLQIHNCTKSTSKMSTIGFKRFLTIPNMRVISSCKKIQQECFAFCWYLPRFHRERAWLKRLQLLEMAATAWHGRNSGCGPMVPRSQVSAFSAGSAAICRHLKSELRPFTFSRMALERPMASQTHLDRSWLQALLLGRSLCHIGEDEGTERIFKSQDFFTVVFSRI